MGGGGGTVIHLVPPRTSFGLASIACSNGAGVTPGERRGFVSARTHGKRRRGLTDPSG
jgi:hypothetical protein